MFKAKKVLIIPLLLTVLLMLLMPGCKEKAASEETKTPTAITPSAQVLSQPELQQILTDSMLAVKNASTYKYALDMNMNMEATGGSQPGKANVTMKSSGTTDIIAKEMQMNLEMTLEVNDIGDNNTSQNISAEMYMMSDSVYMKMALPGMGEQWIKMPLTDELKKTYDLDMVNQQLAPLESAAKIELLRYEPFDGSECYVMKIVPNTESMKDWIKQQQIISDAIKWDELTNIWDMFKEFSYITWIAKDSKLIKKMSAAMLMEIKAGQVGVTESDFDSMSMDIDLDMIMKNYNDPVSIVLPEEAKQAIEIPQPEPSNK